MDARSVASVLRGSRAADRARRVRDSLHEAMPASRTIHRPPAGQRPPAPREFAAFGDGSWVVPAARVVHPERIAIGTGTIVMENSTLWAFDSGGRQGRITIGDGVVLARFNSIVSAYGVTIEDGVASSDSVSIVDTWDNPLRPRAGGPPAPEGGPVVIEAGAYLACNSTIGPGVRVGRGAYVGEGAVVLDDVPPRTVVYGNPATVTRRFDPDAGGWEGPEWP